MSSGEPESEPGLVLCLGLDPEVRDAVAAAGFDVEHVPGNEAAHDRLDAGKVDCVVTGHDPPEADGPALAEWVGERRPGVPVVFHPTDGSEALASEAVAAGVSAYVPGGTGPRRLVSTVRDAVARGRERRAAGLAYREVFENVDVGLTVRDVETGELLDVNERYCDLLGYSRAEALELDIEDVTADLPGYAAEHGRALLDRAVSEPDFSFEWPDRRKDGGVVWVEIDATVTPIEGRDRLLVTVRDVSDRRERERALETLHTAAARIGECGTVEAACEATVEAAAEALDFEMCAVLVAEGEWLVPRAVSEGAPDDGARRMRTDQGLAGRTYRTGESHLVADVAEEPTADPADEGYGSGLSVPVGEVAVFQAVASSPGAFDEADLELAELLVAHTARALDRIRFEAELRRQNERLGEFATVVSHDLRNPLNVAQARLGLAREERDGGSENLEVVDGALSRMDAIIDDTLTLARQGRTAVDPDVVELSTFAGRCWGLVETEGTTLETGDSFPLRADPDRLCTLFENLFRNSVEHGSTTPRSRAREDGIEHGSTSNRAETDDGVEHSSADSRAEDVEHASTEGESPSGGATDGDDAAPTVRVGSIDREGFYVEDDGPGIPAEDRERAFEAGYTTTRTGTGFGLAIVQDVVEAHGWEIAVTEGEAGGARFEVTGVEAAD